MKLKKITAVLCGFFLLTATLSSCGYEIVIRKKGEEESTTAETSGTTGEAASESKMEDAVSASPDENTVTRDAPTISVDVSFRPMPMAEADVVELYTRAMNDVKIRAPGYVRTEYQDISNVKTGRGDIQLMDRILNLVGTELLKASGDEAASIHIMAHDDIAVRETFPLYNKDSGCELTDLSIVKSAVCYTDGKTYKIVITFNDQLNPEPFTSEFGKIMTPVDRNKFSSPIEEYFVVLDLNSYKFNINYTNCEIVCIIDKKSSRMMSLAQKMIMDIDLVMNLDLIIFKTNNIKASGTIVNHLEYYNFDWS